MVIPGRNERTEYCIAPLVGALDLEGRLVLIDRVGSRLFVYNESARSIWDGLARGRDLAGLAAELSGLYRISSERLRADVEVILDHWITQGLVQRCGGPSPPRRSASDAIAPAEAETRDSRHAARQSEQWICTIGGHAFAFDIADGHWTSLLRRMFAHLETPDERPESSISIRRLQGSQFSLREDGRERLRTDNSGLLLGGLHQALLERIHPGIEWLALIHGGAVARDGAALALPAPSGSGKTTLLAHLMTQGFRYLADDLVALAAPEGCVAAWPVPLSVKSGSWGVLAKAHPALRDAQTFLTRGMETRLIVPPQEIWNVGRTPVRAMVFPRYDPAAAGELTRISCADALQRLLADRIWLGHPLAEDRVRAFLAWLEGIPAYTLAYRGLDQGLRGIEKALSP